MKQIFEAMELRSFSSYFLDQIGGRKKRFF